MEERGRQLGEIRGCTVVRILDRSAYPGKNSAQDPNKILIGS